MRTGRKTAAFIIASVAIAAVMAVPAMAASRKKISTVSLEVESNVQPETRYGEEEIEVEVKGDTYTFDYYEIDNVGFNWTREDVPEISIYLRAKDGYYFSLTKASSVKLEGATYIKAVKQDSSEVLKLTVKLPPLSESVGEMTSVKLWDNGFATWDAAPGAGSYEVRLYKNGEGVGVSILTTTDTYYNFQAKMGRPGSYKVKVKPVNAINQDNKGEWVESADINITEEQARRIRNGEVENRPMQGEWKNDADGYWYVRADGTYPKKQWEQIDYKWYFFDENGYMKTGWIDWNGERYYCAESGEMLTNTITPDGTVLDHDGTVKND